MTYLTDNPEMFSLNILQAPPALHRPEIRLSVDEGADLELVRKVCHHFYPRLDFSASEIIACLDHNPSWVQGNAHVKQKTR
ncbi:MAG: hypothetical protein PHI06_11400 [Desulfobulbaceae bacterium]|nr:hypothetical protein [Desulfobulbaceae bacterium]